MKHWLDSQTTNGWRSLITAEEDEASVPTKGIGTRPVYVPVKAGVWGGQAKTKAKAQLYCSSEDLVLKHHDHD